MSETVSSSEARYAAAATRALIWTLEEEGVDEKVIERILNKFGGLMLATYRDEVRVFGDSE